jgi:hypothetical protein
MQNVIINGCIVNYPSAFKIPPPPLPPKPLNDYPHNTMNKIETLILEWNFVRL